MARSVVFDMLRQKRSPAKKSKKCGAKGSVAILKELLTIEVCVSRSPSDNIYSTENRNIGIESRRQILQRHMASFINSWKERVRPEGSFRSVNLISVILARPGLRRGHERSLCNMKDAPSKAAWDLAKTFTSRKMRTKPHFILPLKQGQRQRPLPNYQREEIRDRFRSFSAHAEQKGFEPR